MLDCGVGLSEGCGTRGKRKMRSVLAAAAVLVAFCLPAGAVEFQTPITKQLYTCARPGLQRVAMTTNPAPCCDGQLRCAQFLSTTGMLRNHRIPRT